jgi:hypothetical protein
VETLQRVARADYLAVGIDVREAATVAVAANSRHRIGYVSKARGSRGPHVFM